MNTTLNTTPRHSTKNEGSIPFTRSTDNQGLTEVCTKAAPKTANRLLVISDSPTLSTGFACVSRNLLSYWAAAKKHPGREDRLFEQVDVWGIGYAGWPHNLPYRLFPAQSYESPLWHDVRNLSRLAGLIRSQKYTHVWIMQDLFLLSAEHCLSTVGAALDSGAKKWGLKSCCYFPVDSLSLEPWERNFIYACTTGVPYTAHGLLTIDNGIPALMSKIVLPVPHGVDTDIFRPIVQFPKRALREKIFTGVEFGEDDFLILAVSQHQKRKGLVQTLQVFKRLREMMPNRVFRLYMHMPSENKSEGTDLKVVARNLGLPDVMFGDSSFVGNHAMIDENGLNQLYNAADLLLTTTYGEGWGLPITEAMAAGCPVAGPRHTSVAELLADGRGVLFGTLGDDWIVNDNSRLRPRTDVDDASLQIANAIEAHPESSECLYANANRAMNWVNGSEFCWERIAKHWLSLMGVEQEVSA